MKKFVLIYILAVVALAVIVRANHDKRNDIQTACIANIPNDGLGFSSNGGDMSGGESDESEEESEEKELAVSVQLSTQPQLSKAEEVNENIISEEAIDLVDEKSEYGLVSPNSSIELVKTGKGVKEQILTRLAYTVSYNPRTRCPNWVAWHLTKNHTDGSFSRSGVPYVSKDGVAYGIGPMVTHNHRGQYFLDEECKEPRPGLMDWPNNKYQMTHGHMCPAADNRWSKTAMNQSFLLTNMCPQANELNRSSWTSLEELCRYWAEQYGDVYIACGPIFNGNPTRTIGEGKIAVPDAFFKVVLTLGKKPKAIGFIYQNDDSDQSLDETVCSVDQIEKMTGFDFFYHLNDNIENKIESNNNLKIW